MPYTPSEDYLFQENARQLGWIEVICGSMFSGKTEELIRRINRAVIARQTVKIFKPAIDNRYHENNIVSHTEVSKVGIAIRNAAEMLNHVSPGDVVAIDEAQFFDAEIVGICLQLANQKHRVIVAGLDMDSRGRPFGSVPQLMACAEFVTKLHAICSVCGNMAGFTYRHSQSTDDIFIGAAESYEARCRNCFNKS